MEQPSVALTPSSLLAIIKRDWKNPANHVTVIRMAGALVLPAFFTSGRSRKVRLFGVALFVVLALTDKLDGWLAKKIFGSTDLGKMLDPTVDKELIIVTLLVVLKEAIREGDHQLVWILSIALAILAKRETAVARIKLEAQRRDSKVESARESGRVSMLAQCIAAGALLLPFNSPKIRAGKIFLFIASVGASLYSWWDYHRTYRVPTS